MNPTINKFLLDDTPIVVQPKLAELFKSLDEAAVLQQIHYWVSRSDKVHDDLKWTYNTMEDWLKQFPWIKSTRTLKRYFDDLVDKGILKVGNFNKVKFDRTKWYTIDYDAFYDFVNRGGQNVQMEVDNSTGSNQTKLPDPSGQNDSTYTLDYPDTNTDINPEEQEPASKTDNPFRLAQELNINVNGGTHSQIFIDYVNRLGAGLVCYALYQTDKADRPGWNYLLSILNRLEHEKIKTVQQAEEQDQQRRQQNRRRSYGRQPRVETLPEWAKPGYKPPKPLKSKPALYSDGSKMPEMPKY
ncbi:DnaD domain-containing protein [Limosilactobacillus caecicola]|uniref:DnaD domain-containing protein n=1 Tax=Limosilactobacillus caecicola TaxID=2941332 RepID=UPI00203B41A2|nr:DnaD domain protein [Limosilactobacillus caecicola]